MKNAILYKRTNHEDKSPFSEEEIVAMIAGVKRLIEMWGPDCCCLCEGSGRIQISMSSHMAEPCWKCEGRGHLDDRDDICNASVYLKLTERSLFRLRTRRDGLKLKLENRK